VIIPNSFEFDVGKILIRRFEPSLGRKYRITEFLPESQPQLTRKQSASLAAPFPLNAALLAKRCFKNQKPVTNSGIKGLTTNVRPNDGSKAAKR
jgi:hypothetical protein